MADQTLVKLGLDIAKGNFANHSESDSMEVLRKALVDINGGEKLDFKKMRAGASNGLFEIIEEILQKTVIEGLPDDNFFQQFVDARNLALGDQNSFYVEDNSLFTVADVAMGTQNIRRQRINVGTNVTIPTTLKLVKIYEELGLLLSGRRNLTDLITKVQDSFKLKIKTDLYTAFTNTLSSLPTEFKTSGAYAEDSLMTIVDHVEAATGKKATILGTKKALRNVVPAVVSEDLKSQYNNLGYYGVFNGTQLMSMSQVHKVGTYEFMLSDKDLYIIAGDAKPVKFVTEGDSLMIQGNPMDKADLTQEYLYGSTYGTGTVISNLYGMYRLP